MRNMLKKLSVFLAFFFFLSLPLFSGGKGSISDKSLFEKTCGIFYGLFSVCYKMPEKIIGVDPLTLCVQVRKEITNKALEDGSPRDMAERIGYVCGLMCIDGYLQKPFPDPIVFRELYCPYLLLR